MRRRRAERTAQYQDATYRDLLGRLAGNIRRLRGAREWTQEAAAHRCEMSTRLLQQIEGGDANVTFTTLARLSKGLGVDGGRLLAPQRRPPKRPRA